MILSMAWSSLAHLPTNEDEYWYILSNLENGMSIKEVDTIIAAYKNKVKVQHHYRSNLAKLGVYKIENNCIILNYDVNELVKERNLLKDILTKALMENVTDEINDVITSIILTQTYELKTVIDSLHIVHPLIDRNSLTRWIRPVVCLLKIVDILSKTPNIPTFYIRILQETYLQIAKKFSNSEPLELIENELKKIDSKNNIVAILDSILENPSIRFKIELIMMPSWASKNKSYKIGKDLYTHIKIKGNLLYEEDENEQKHNTK